MEQFVDWMLFDLNSFFASCEQQDRPELRGRPVAVVAMKTDSTSVLAASVEAKRKGINTGTRVGEARRMCPGLVFVETRHRLYLDFHERIMKAVDEIIPIHTVCSVDEVSCQLMGTQRSLSKALELSRKLKAHVQKSVGECMTSSIGLGPNTMIAKMASDMMKPNGLVWIPKDEIQQKLAPLSVRDIPGVGARMQDRLNRRGVFKVADILRLSEGEARSVWGSILGVRTLHALRGEPYIYEMGATKSISHQHVLPPDLRNKEKAFQVALKLLNKACVRLRKNNYRTGALTLQINFVDGTFFDNSLRFQKTTDTGFLMNQLQALWNFNTSTSILRISVVLSSFEQGNEQQLTFFDQTSGRREKAFAIADQINEKYGMRTIFSANLMGTHDKGRGGIAFSRVPSKEEFE